jgi:RimJ/RimL family protein N-acetyltransferase
MYEVKLETERLVLRWFREDDFPAYVEIATDPEVMKFIGGQQTQFEAWKAMTSHIGHWYFRGYGVFAVEEKSSGKMVGRIGFMNPPGWPGFELGWTLSRSSWGKGYATEAATAAIDWSFANLGWSEVIHSIAPENLASQALARRLGSINRGPGRLPPPHEEVRIDIWGQSSEDWLTRRKVSNP